MCIAFRVIFYLLGNYSGLILLKMLSEYVDISKYLPTLSSEVVHRVVEILKLFNTRTCQLVLGAGAMQVLPG
jgi:vacuolar protein sorting-associated protein 54